MSNPFHISTPTSTTSTSTPIGQQFLQPLSHTLPNPYRAHGEAAGRKKSRKSRKSKKSRKSRKSRK
jgi:hypothetical protein